MAQHLHLEGFSVRASPRRHRLRILPQRQPPQQRPHNSPRVVVPDPRRLRFQLQLATVAMPSW
jgi:hypothetical protein